MVPTFPAIVAVLPDHATENSPFVVPELNTVRLDPSYERRRPPAFPVNKA